MLKVSGFKFYNNRGFIFLEVLIGVALVGIVFLVLIGIGAQSMALSGVIKKSTQVDSLLKEEMEAVRSFRDGSTWTTNGLGVVSTGSGNPYHVILDTGTNPPKWALQTGTQTVGEFTRSVIFDRVSRNPSTQDIEGVYNGANDDPNTRKITVRVVHLTKTYEVITYLTNWQSN